MLVPSRMLVGLVLVVAALGCGLRREMLLPARGLEREIRGIEVIDNHAHPLSVVHAGEVDAGWDALATDGGMPETMASAHPARLRADNLEYLGAWRRLWGYPFADASPAHLEELRALRMITRSREGDAYPAWVLRRLGIETMLANRVVLGRGISPPLFRWVPYVDALVLPLDNTDLGNANRERRAYVAGLGRQRERLFADLGRTGLPVTLPEYLSDVATPALETYRARGAVAVKLELAYLRPLDVAPVPEFEARRIYAQYVLGGRPDPGQYKALQDFLFRWVAREAGRQGLAVHVHTGVGAGAYFDVPGGDPALLGRVLDDPGLRGTNFVLVRGGWPYTDVVSGLLAKPNVYADISGQTFLQQPRTLAGVLRKWLELHPERILFGTAALPVSEHVGWEEVAWLSLTSARRALALTLSDMVADGEITRAHALRVARMVLRDNAIALYGLETSEPNPGERGVPAVRLEPAPVIERGGASSPPDDRRPRRGPRGRRPGG